jgi:hypothetical protein
MSYYINPYTLYLRDRNMSKISLVLPGINKVTGRMSQTQRKVKKVDQLTSALSPSFTLYNAQGSMPTGSSSFSKCVAYGNGMFIAGGYDTISSGRLIKSVDGINWTDVSSFPPGFTPNGIAYML